MWRAFGLVDMWYWKDGTSLEVMEVLPLLPHTFLMYLSFLAVHELHKNTAFIIKQQSVLLIFLSSVNAFSKLVDLSRESWELLMDSQSEAQVTVWTSDWHLNWKRGQSLGLSPQAMGSDMISRYKVSELS